MFGFLKKKLSKVIDSISKKTGEAQSVQDSAPAEDQKAPETVEQPTVESATQVEEVQQPVHETSEEKNPMGEIEAEAAEIQQEQVVSPERTEEQKPEEVAQSMVESGKEEPLEKYEKSYEEPKHLEPETAIAEVVTEPPKEEPEPEAAPKKKSWIKRIAESVSKKVTEKTLTESDVDPILDELKTDLVEADVALSVSEKISDDLKRSLVNKPIKRGKEKEEIVSSLRSSLLDILSLPRIDLIDASQRKKPVTILFLGFNGVGKTTSLAKTASWLISQGRTCVFAAADTFRAAAEEQLEVHANNLKVNLIKHRYGADPAAVIFDAIEHAKSKGIDFVLADTAGRAHTNANLMDQLSKIVRVNKPDMKILVIDSLAGNDALIQARMFNEVGIDAVIFTKVDVNEKGGAILSVAHELKKPILFLGVGQEYSELSMFDAEKFVDSLLA